MNEASITTEITRPIGILAELTHRCPLQCPYCSNPAELLKADRELDTETWIRVLDEAARLGVLQVHLSGGEPTLRRDLVEIIAAASEREIYTNLITAGVIADAATLSRYAEAGLNHVQVSVQGADAETTELIGRFKGGLEKKLRTAREVRGLGLPLTLNTPIHKHNIHQVEQFIELALSLDADRLEIANVQYYGWAYLNRAQLMPSREAVERQVVLVEQAQDDLKGILNIDFVTPDYYADYPKPCMGGWAYDAMVITPEGKVLPCHAAETIKTMSFDTVTETPLSDIWIDSPALNAFRGMDWMQEPCRSCPRRHEDFGGCRCQAFALTGDAAATDPVCRLSPHHGAVEKLATSFSGQTKTEFVYRRI